MDIEDTRLDDMLERSLSEDERNLLKVRFGLTGEPTTTLAETGEMLGVSADDIRQTVALALRKLRTAMVG
jgi:RNA polymerase sigma factor (sigma-70 family)